jgi:hypothetical protein
MFVGIGGAADVSLSWAQKDIDATKMTNKNNRTFLHDGSQCGFGMFQFANTSQSAVDSYDVRFGQGVNDEVFPRELLRISSSLVLPARRE